MLCNSWVIVNRISGKPVLETWQKPLIDKVNLTKYEVLTAHAWLVKFNTKVRSKA